MFFWPQACNSSVSYTHLDVYKRQKVACDNMKTWNDIEVLVWILYDTRFGCTTQQPLCTYSELQVNCEGPYTVNKGIDVVFRIHAEIQGRSSSHPGSNTAETICLFGMKTVSYTHLDVYKRQV